MCNTIRIFSLFVGLSVALNAEVPAVSFNGISYVIATVSVDKGVSGSITNEYVPKGETIDSWTTLLAVRYWPKINKVADATGPWLKMIHPLLCRNVGVFARNDKDVLLEAWLAAPNRLYIEIDLQRFVAEPGTGGVKAYQYAQKILTPGGAGNPTSYMESRGALFTAIGNLRLTPVEKAN
jgi:hypothetical protein